MAASTPAPAVGDCPWCRRRTLESQPVILSRYRDIEYTLGYCTTCRTRVALPTTSSDLNYNDVQRYHVGYARHRADNEWIHNILANGPDDYWAVIAARYLCDSTMDSRYVHVIEQALEARRRGRRLNILEVGCNLGYVGAVLTRLGHDYTGLELQDEAIKQAREYYGPHYHATTVEEYAARGSGTSFDIVCAFEVIEHIENPRVFLDECCNACSAGGRVILTTPDAGHVAKFAWETDRPPIHLFYFSQSSFRWLRSEGYRVVFATGRVSLTSQDSAAGSLRFWRQRLRRRGAPEIPNVDPSSSEFTYSAVRTSQTDRLRTLSPALVVGRAASDVAGLIAGWRPRDTSMVIEVSRAH